MEELCFLNCRHRYMIEKLDYSHGGCEHSNPGGFICMAFAGERERMANWMVGLVGEHETYCECWEARR